MMLTPRAAHNLRLLIDVFVFEMQLRRLPGTLSFLLSCASMSEKIDGGRVPAYVKEGTVS